ncbi:MAG: extracellular solute-binding protein, partial [Planctomycetota bacterium]
KDYPDSLLDFIDPKWQGECAIAKPLFGTTATHASVLYSKWGEEKAGQFFDRLKENAAIENGNKQVAVKVSQGVYAFGLTDTDDAIIEIEQGYPVAIVFPDQSEEEQGALLIPNTLSITGGPNPKEAKQLIKYLLTRAIEEKLAEGASAQIPLHRKAHIRSRVEPEDLRVMEVDFAAAAEAWENVKSELAEKFPL